MKWEKNQPFFRASHRLGDARIHERIALVYEYLNYCHVNLIHKSCGRTLYSCMELGEAKHIAEDWVNDKISCPDCEIKELKATLEHALEDLQKLMIGDARIEDVAGIIPEIENVLKKYK